MCGTSKYGVYLSAVRMPCDNPIALDLNYCRPLECGLSSFGDPPHLSGIPTLG